MLAKKTAIINLAGISLHGGKFGILLQCGPIRPSGPMKSIQPCLDILYPFQSQTSEELPDLKDEKIVPKVCRRYYAVISNLRDVIFLILRRM
jgi:hypothetical protein